MTFTIKLTEEEFHELDDLIRKELTISHNELRRSGNAMFRDNMRHRIQLTEHLLEHIVDAHNRLVPAGK